MSKVFNRNVLVLSVASALVAACGGGGGGGGGVTPPPPPTNQAPNVTPVGDKAVSEGSTAVASVVASDPDGDALYYSLSGDDAGAFSVSSSGVVTFSAAPDFEAPADANGDNVYNITVTVTDGVDNTMDSFSVSVNDLLEGRVIDGPVSGATVTLYSRPVGSSDEYTVVTTVQTDADGRYELPELDREAFEYKVTSEGGTDTATGKALPNLALVAEVPSGSSGSISTTNVNAITTLLSVVETPEEQQALLTKLGIEGSPEDLANADIWEGSENGDEAAQAAQRVNSQLISIIQTVATVVDSASAEPVDPLTIVEAVAAEIVEATDEQGEGTVDLADSTTIAEVLTDTVAEVAPEAEVSEEVVEAVATAVSNVNSVLGDENTDPTSDTAAAVAGASQESLQESVEDVASGNTDVNTFEADTSPETLLEDVPVEPDAPDNDQDGLADAVDPDDDNDGVNDVSDAFPFDNTESVDTDGDGVGNNEDTDDDNDTVLDANDAYPLASNYSDTAFDISREAKILLVDYDPATGANPEQSIDTWTVGTNASGDAEVNVTIEGALNGANIQNALDGLPFQSPELVIPLAGLPDRVGTQSATASIMIKDAAQSVAAGDVAREIMVDSLALSWTGDGQSATIELVPQTVTATYVTADDLEATVTVENVDSDFLTVTTAVEAPPSLDVKFMNLVDKVISLVPGFLTSGVYEMSVSIDGAPILTSRRDGSVTPVNNLNVTFEVSQ